MRRAGILKAGLGVAALLVLMLLAREILPYIIEPEPSLTVDDLQIDKVAEGLGNPTCMEWIDSEWLLVCDADSGSVLALALNESEFSAHISILGGLDNPHGLLLWEDGDDGSEHLFVSQAGKLESWEILQGSNPAEWELGPRSTLISGVPSSGHQQNAIKPGPDGDLIWHSGSTCNVCTEEDPRSAALLSVDPRTGNHSVVASGVRNSFDGVWVPDVGYVFTDNGHDWDGDDFPPEELNLLMIGADYGWPNTTVDNPVPAGSLPPIAEYIPHSSVNGIDLRPSSSSLPGGEHTVYATVFGSWNTVMPVGKQVIRIDLLPDPDHPQGWSSEISVVVEDLATPLALRFHPEGDLYFTEYAHGTLYRVTAAQS